MRATENPEHTEGWMRVVSSPAFTFCSVAEGGRKNFLQKATKVTKKNGRILSCDPSTPFTTFARSRLFATGH